MAISSQQQTIAESVQIEGVGIHSGNRVHLRLLPAEPDTGVRFRRVDLSGQPQIPAHHSAVSPQPRRTALAVGDAEVNTCEHLLATTSALGIDNLLVEIDAAELPGLDGSSLPYVNALGNAGRVTQSNERTPIRIAEPLSLVRDQQSLLALPFADGLRITYLFAPDNGAFGGDYLVDLIVTPDAFVNEIAPARTFVTMKEAKLAQAAGLGRGATPENTIVWDDDQLMAGQQLRLAGEPARHKALDLIGDMALLGKPLQAHLVATRTGHRENLELVRRIAETVDHRGQAQPLLG